MDRVKRNAEIVALVKAREMPMRKRLPHHMQDVQVSIACVG